MGGAPAGAALRVRMVAAFAQILLPAFGEGGNGQGSLHVGNVVGGVVLGNVEAGNHGHGNVVDVAAD